MFAPQGNGHWTLIRVTLGSPGPREEQLTVTGFTTDQLNRDEVKGLGNVSVSPDGRYAVVRTRTWEGAGNPATWGLHARAAIAVIDLQSWNVLSERIMTDPAYARGSWTFSKDGVLITESTLSSTRKRGHPAETYSDAHQAVALLLPGLQPSLTCNYTVAFGPFSTSRGSPYRESSVTDVSASCVDLVKLADASSVTDLYHPRRIFDRVAQQLHFLPEEFVSPPHTNNFNGCDIADVAVGERLALYECFRSHHTWYDTLKTTALSLSVVSVPDGKEVLRVPESGKGPRSVGLVTISGQDYLVILEDGVKLIGYRL